MFEFGIKDIIDIVLVALMLYYIYRLMKESRSLNVFIGIMVFKDPALLRSTPKVLYGF